MIACLEGDGQGSLAYCSPWGRKESNMTKRLNWTELEDICNLFFVFVFFLLFTLYFSFLEAQPIIHSSFIQGQGSSYLGQISQDSFTPLHIAKVQRWARNSNCPEEGCSLSLGTTAIKIMESRVARCHLWSSWKEAENEDNRLRWRKEPDDSVCFPEAVHSQPIMACLLT